MRTVYHIAPKRTGHGWVAHMVRSWIDGVPLADLENWSPGKVMQRFSHDELSKGIILIQTRDLLNWYASYTGGGAPNSNGVLNNWSDVTKEFYEVNVFKGYDVVYVYYDEFFKNREYRQEVCNQLGGSYNEKKLQSVGHGGGGSSFDKLSFDKRAQEMNVLHRYRQVPSHIFYELLQGRKELLNFYLKHVDDADKRNFIQSLGLNTYAKTD